MKTNFFVVLIFILAFSSCSDDIEKPKDFNHLANLPKDTGGIQTPFLKGSTASPYGFYVYTPSAYLENGPEFPLLIFLHGAGEKGNSQLDPDVLKLILKNGPPKLIKNGSWNPTYPMIVASPQCENWWEAEKIHDFIRFITENYNVNKKRVYVTGLSMGGYGTFSYASKGKDSFAAAMIPICGGGNINQADIMAELPIWAFHGLADSTVKASNSINLIKAINDHHPSVKAKLTLYPGVGHDSWAMTYDGTGMGKESPESDPFDMKIYDWLFQYEKELPE